MANGLLTIPQITRNAVQLFRNSNRFLLEHSLQWGSLFAEPEELREERERSERAEARARELLRSWLTPEQLESFERCRSFNVVGSAGGRYRLRSAASYGVISNDGYCYCVVPQGAPALGDILLAQKIGLETDELGTLAKANRLPTRELAP